MCPSLYGLIEFLIFGFEDHSTIYTSDTAQTPFNGIFFCWNSIPNHEKVA